MKPDDEIVKTSHGPATVAYVRDYDIPFWSNAAADAAGIANNYRRSIGMATGERKLDNCSMCKGQRGGVPGNENIVHGLRVCDYCSADISRVADAVRDETLRAASRIACLVAGDMYRMVSCPTAEKIELVRLKLGRWQSDAAMKLWGEATNRDGERLHELYDGNGRPRHAG